MDGQGKKRTHDLISRQAAIKDINMKLTKWSLLDREGRHVGIGLRNSDVIRTLFELPPVQQTALTADDIETIRIHLSAFKEGLCNQGRWTEAAEYERLIQRLTGKGGQDEKKAVR